MPVLVTYQGRPVKRRHRRGEDLRLILVHPTPGERGERLVVSQTLWQQHGRVEIVATMPDRRAMAASREVSVKDGGDSND